MGSDREADAPSKVVGIGASAGGLQALEAVLDNLTPEARIAFVVIQHLSPDFDSMMDKLLARHTAMPVVLITHACELKGGVVYLLPPGKQAIISNHRLLLTERTERSSLSFPVDEFFRSLAQNNGENAIGVVLSGTGTDGSQGIRHIRSAGGTVIAQSHDSAAFDGMPRSACDTGVVDLILDPPEIARALSRIANDHYSVIAPEPERKSAEVLDHMAPSMRLIFNLLHREFGLDFSQYKSRMIARRIERRIKLSGISDINEYVKLADAQPMERNRLYHDMLIGVTGFFRDSNVFERLELDVIPQLLTDVPENEEFRCWVAGTATGEEAYSIAILLAEEFEKRGVRRNVRIFASDVHEASLTFAGRGVYTPDRMNGVTPERRERYFIERQDGFHVAPELRKMIVFTPHNMIQDAPFTRLDLISCRNVLIYFTPSTQHRVLSLFHFGLKTGGALCLGNSESPGDLRTDFQPIDESLRIFRKCRELAPAVRARSAQRSSFAPFSSHAIVQERASARHLLSIYDRLLGHLRLPSLLISEKREVLHVFGGAGRFLQFTDGRPRNDVLEVIHPDLRTALSLALIHLRRDREPVSIESITCTIGEETLAVSLTVELFETDSETPGSILVRIRLAPADAPESQVLPLSTAQLNTVEQLERELQFTQDNLQSTIEELQTTNEELQSTNEQLTASNEELQSTNEELHSVNEELYTVNAEHQRKIDELTELNDDIDNLLTTTNVHTLFLDSHLRLRRFTPRIAELFNLIPQDIGRSIRSFTHKLQAVNLADIIRDVIKTEQSIDREVKDDNGKWYLLRIFPYLSRGTVEGAVVTLVDVTTLQAATEALQKSEERFDLAVRGSNAGIWDWKDVSQESIWCSSRMYSLLGRSPHEEMTVSFWKELIHPDDLDRVTAALDSHLNDDTPFDIEYRMEYGDEDSYRWFHMRGAAERRRGNRAVRMAGSFEDVTDRRNAEEEVQRGVERRDQFLAMLSHELRNPLGAVTNAIALLSSQETDSETRDRALEVVQRQLRQISRLLDDLLDVSRITHGKIDLRRGRLDLRRTVDQAISVVRQGLEDSALNLSVELPAEAVVVNGDPARLEQVTVNLLTNAVKYTPSGGDIHIALTTEGDEAAIQVRDSGVGIPPEKLNEIFFLFYQSDETLDRSNGGMGVGLTLVNAVVQLHGGTVLAESNGPGTGSLFTVTLPLAPESEVPEEAPAACRALPLQSIVIVEDIDDAREMLAALLTLRNLEVHEASDGAAGLELIRSVRPDAAIIDIGLPEMNGHQIARRLRADPEFRETRLVALTGYGQDADRRKVSDSGFDLHLVKPLNPECLDRVLAALTDTSKRGRMLQVEDCV